VKTAKAITTTFVMILGIKEVDMKYIKVILGLSTILIFACGFAEKALEPENVSTQPETITPPTEEQLPVTEQKKIVEHPQNSDVKTGSIPGISSDDVENYFKSFEFVDFFSEAAGFGDLLGYQYTLSEETANGYFYSVEIYWKEGRGKTVDIITANIYKRDSMSSFSYDETILEFLSFAASIPYEGAKPRNAQKWVEENTPMLSKNTSFVEIFEGVRFELDIQGGTAHLYIGEPVPWVH